MKTIEERIEEVENEIDDKVFELQVMRDALKRLKGYKEDEIEKT